jgi:hypothetical protein
VLAGDPDTLERIWSNVKQVMAPGALDPLTKELIYGGERHEQLPVLHRLPQRRRAQ